MRRPNRIAQLYGYSVCLVAVITSLIATSQVVDASFRLAGPTMVSGGFGPDMMFGGEIEFGRAVGSFETYRDNYQERYWSRRNVRTIEVPPQGAAVQTAPAAPVEPMKSDAELRRLYEARRSEELAVRRFQAIRSLVKGALLILVSVALFVSHWLWVRKLLALDLQADRAVAAEGGA